jgi:hypothetical protein
MVGSVGETSGLGKFGSATGGVENVGVWLIRSSFQSDGMGAGIMPLVLIHETAALFLDYCCRKST